MRHNMKVKMRNMAKKYFLLSKIYKLASQIKIKLRSELTDEEFLRIKFKENMGQELNLEAPISYNEKLQWLKLNDRNPAYTTMVDKYEVRNYISQKIGSKHLIPLYGVWDRFGDIEFEKLPNQFVLKANHDCGSILICKDKNKFNFKRAERELSTALKRNYYYVGREWPYKNVKPRIIAEKYMIDESSLELKDYKYFCFNGEAKIMFIASDRLNKDKETKFDFYDMNFTKLPIEQGYPNSKRQLEMPKNFLLMKHYAEILSSNIPHVRVDFYDINGHVYFGEMTFYHFGGTMMFEPNEWDNKIGNWIDLSLAFNEK